jgi:hypothetical protein
MMWRTLRQCFVPVAVVAVSSGVLAGCSGNARVSAGLEQATGTPRPAATEATVATGATATPSAAPTLPPGTPSPRTSLTAERKRLDDANKALGEALAQFTAATARRDEAMSFNTARQAMTSAMSSVRNALDAERAAAYSGTRSRSRVNANAALVHSAAGRVLAASAQQHTTIARVRAELRKVDAARAVVEKRLGDLQAALRLSSSRDVAPVVTAVQQALSAESSRRKAVLVELADVEARARTISGNAARARQQAGVIQSKAC